MDADLPLEKVAISGPTLSSLLHRFSSASSSAIDGLLFGKFSLLASSSLSDDISPSPSPSSLVATVTSFISTTDSRHGNHRRNYQPIGIFSARRRSPLRPSLREFSLSHSLSLSSSSPNLIFLLLTTPSDATSTQTLIHTFEYRAYRFNRHSLSFDPVQLSVVNVGPAFRGHYDAFSPNSELPYMQCESRGGGGSPMREDSKESLSEMKRVARDQKELDLYAEGYEIEKLNRLTGSEATGYVGGVEDLYERMLARLESLARAVETSSAKVLEQENYNMKLRHRVAGLD